jgi:hypothetical protein
MIFTFLRSAYFQCVEPPPPRGSAEHSLENAEYKFS